jgi:ribosomal-protein-alanine N-acetyltransferase
MPLTLPLPILTDRTEIRLVEERDLPDLLAVNGDDEATRFLPYESWRSMEDAQAWLLRMKSFQDSGVALQFVIVERQSNIAIGTCLLFKYDEASARADIGYVLGRRFWRQGYAREALRALIAHAFHTQGVRRLEAEVHTHNEPSNNLIVQLGFSREGVLRQRYVSKGEIRDINIYGLLKDEYTTPIA